MGSGVQLPMEACEQCRQVNRHVAFVDETARSRLYGLAAAMACRCQLGSVRRALRGLVRPGQRRLHFAKENVRYRKFVLSAISRMEVRALFVGAVANPVSARTDCWTRLIPDLVSLGVNDLRIERIEGSESRDRRDIHAALAAKGQLGQLTYRHGEPSAEPLLWVADAVAWSAGAGGEWRSRVQNLLLEP